MKIVKDIGLLTEMMEMNNGKRYVSEDKTKILWSEFRIRAWFTELSIVMMAFIVGFITQNMTIFGVFILASSLSFLGLPLLFIFDIPMWVVYLIVINWFIVIVHKVLSNRLEKPDINESDEETEVIELKEVE